MPTIINAEEFKNIYLRKSVVLHGGYVIIGNNGIHKTAAKNRDLQNIIYLIAL